eukprot:CFRG0605T1
MNSNLEKAEEKAEQVFRSAKKYLPTIARLLLVATFIDDGIRMWTHWHEQAQFFRRRFPLFICHAFVVVNLVLQLLASGMVLARKQVVPAVAMLFAIVVLQTALYSPLWGANFFARNLSLVGGLVLLLAEARVEKDKNFADVPSMGDEDKQKAVMQLVGRVLVGLMFLTLVHFDMSAFKMTVTVIDMALLLCVTVGFNTKFTALVLCLSLSLRNMFMNPFWAVPSWQVDYVKYDFFQTLSVVGGLLMVVNLGAGGLSVDEKKKKF